MNDIKQSPELLRSAKSGDLVTLDGDTFKFERMTGGICLTSVDSKLNEHIHNQTDEDTYMSLIRHVRVGGYALLSINELIDAIQSCSYTIDQFQKPA